MKNYATKDRNAMWKGGRSIASNGYVLIRVGVEHHLSDVRGYAYEHRILAEQKLGRKLLRDEIVHHVNGNKQDNSLKNLEIVSSQAEHRFHHRLKDSRRRMPSESNPSVTCACGCKQVFPMFDESGRPRTFVSGHNPPLAPTEEAILEALKDGCLHRSEIASRIGIPVKNLATALSKMKRKQIVEQVRRSVWGLKNDINSVD